jgi:hypothetical protein
MVDVKFTLSFVPVGDPETGNYIEAILHAEAAGGDSEDYLLGTICTGLQVDTPLLFARWQETIRSYCDQLIKKLSAEGGGSVRQCYRPTDLN